MADLTSLDGFKDWLLVLVVGAAGGLISLVRRTDLSTWERLSTAQNQLVAQRLDYLEREVKELKARLEDHLP
jgi:hypothetical protein